MSTKVSANEMAVGMTGNQSEMFDDDERVKMVVLPSHTNNVEDSREFHMLPVSSREGGHHYEFTTQLSMESDENSDTDPNFVFSDEEYDWRQVTPEGARRSQRNKTRQSMSPPRLAAGPSPGGALTRDMPEDQVEAEVQKIRSMWEMAAIHDFLRLFKHQLKLSRDFGADELERALVTSPGDSGLLADLHTDIMKGTSPKNPITIDNWMTHLANKIKHHWKPLLCGQPCPFKPDKYYESVTYADLSSENRVQALHFLCCLRCDRPDIASRIWDVDRPKTKKEIQAAKRSQQPAQEAAEDVDAFRLGPAGVDSSGISYYFFDCHDSSSFRLYREVPSFSRPGSGLKDGEESPPSPAHTWALAATTVTELESVAERLNRSMKSPDKELANRIQQEFLTGIHARQEAEERKTKAARRVQRRLGVDAGILEEDTRSRRGRRQVNYAFTEYDDMLRSAIRRSQRIRDASPKKRSYSPIDPVEEALQGLRRGRSAGALRAHDVSSDIDERALRRNRSAHNEGSSMTWHTSDTNQSRQECQEISSPIRNRHEDPYVEALP